MSYAIIGFGKIGHALAKAFARNGIEVSVATRMPPLASWLDCGSDVAQIQIMECELTAIIESAPECGYWATCPSPIHKAARAGTVRR